MKHKFYKKPLSTVEVFSRYEKYRKKLDRLYLKADVDLTYRPTNEDNIFAEDHHYKPLSIRHIDGRLPVTIVATFKCFYLVKHIKVRAVNVNQFFKWNISQAEIDFNRLALMVKTREEVRELQSVFKRYKGPRFLNEIMKLHEAHKWAKKRTEELPRLK